MSEWTIREATPEERREVHRMEGRHFGDAPARPGWFLDQNPAGPALVLVAVTAAGRIAGSRALWPWPVVADGEPLSAGQSGRLLVYPEFRNRGVSLALGRALRERAAERGYTVTFTFPSTDSIPGHRRLGSRIDPFLERRLAPLRARAFWSRAPGVFDLPLRWARIRFGRGRDARWRPARDFGRDADRLWPEVARRPGVRGVRDAAFALWRFSRKSGREYQTWCFPDEGPARLLAALRFEGPRARVVDLWGEEDPALLTGALAALCRELARQGFWRVECSPPIGGAWWECAGRAGFWIRRQGVPLARWLSGVHGDLNTLHWITNYQLTEGDSDYA